MSSTMWGADADALDALAGQVRASGRALDGTQARLGRSIHASPWNGLDADRFRQRWDAEYRRTMLAASSFLAGTGTALCEQADQQRRASAGTAAGPSVVGAAARSQPSLRDRIRDARRGHVVDFTELSDDEWRDLVARGSHGTKGNMRMVRAFDTTRVPGDGILVLDFFIPFENAFYLRGDDRGHVDPLLGDLGVSDSRIMAIIDRETGRGMVSVTESHFLVGPTKQAFPIELGDASQPFVNQFDIDASRDRIKVRLDAVNSLTAGTGSVDATYTLERQPDGTFSVDRGGDRYPSVGIYQYAPGASRPVVVDTFDSEPWQNALAGWPDGGLPDFRFPRIMGGRLFG